MVVDCDSSGYAYTQFRRTQCHIRMTKCYVYDIDVCFRSSRHVTVAPQHLHLASVLSEEFTVNINPLLCRAGVRQLAALFIVFRGGSSSGGPGVCPRKIVKF